MTKLRRDGKALTSGFTTQNETVESGERLQIDDCQEYFNNEVYIGWPKPATKTGKRPLRRARSQLSIVI